MMLKMIGTNRRERMQKKRLRIHIGLRTLKTAAAVILAMVVVDAYGATTSKLIFAMLGAMAAVQPTFKESLESCLTQIVGVLFGAVAGLLLMALRLPVLVTAGIAIVIVITAYNALGIRFSPSLACLIVVTLCTAEDAQPIAYALTRIWDTAIGLGIGMALNTLIFPYDNSNRIHALVESLDKEVIRFLEDMFDGDDVMPDADKMMGRLDDLALQLRIFSNQKLLLKLGRQQRKLEQFRICEGKARELLARMEVLSRVARPGRLNEENRRRLEASGANIRDQRPLDSVLELDVVTNYHVRQILSLRLDLLAALKREEKI